ncbi:helix-turn-helix domain-containing protein [Flavobacterium sp.]|uniref:helix-turn-helix domain-containing protein n=1 Tax=Flavobacterium sp. TaxID=239 RepID=UPI003A91F5FE
MSLKIFIKYMVSLRCKIIVKAELDRLEIKYGTIELGEIEIKEPISKEQSKALKVSLIKVGLELMDDKKAILIEKIKNIIIELVYKDSDFIKTKKSEYISSKLNYDYTYLANIFSEATGTTIEHYIINHKIERVKELLIYDELSLTQISYLLNYSSVAHLSAQFKKITGLTPTFFKTIKEKKRKELQYL